MTVTPSDLRSAFVYDPDCGKVWRIEKNSREAFASKCTNGYLKGNFKGKTLLAHRVAWAITYGKWPEQIDHINGKRDDNRLCNLRSVPASQNQRNRALCKDNKTGVMGVVWEPLRKKWRAEITRNYKTKTLGRFDVREDAVEARLAAESEFGFHPNHGRAA